MSQAKKQALQRDGSRSKLDGAAPVALLALILWFSAYFVGQKPFKIDNDATSNWVQLGLCLGGFALISWSYRLTQLGRPKAYQVLRDRLFVVIGIGSFFGYFNFGHLHFDNFVHVWDTYHYHIGAKYFSELNYERLYDCTEAVGIESGRRAEVERRTITDLRTNIIVRTDELIAHPEEHCKRFFTPERWRQFSADINSYRSWVGEQRWTEILQDHGYNATPVWTLMGRFWANALSGLDGLVTPDIPRWTNPKTGKSYPGSAESAIAAQTGEHHVLSQYNEGLRLRGGFDPPFTRYLGGRHVILLNLLDPLFLILTCVIIWWAFGPRGFAIAAIVLGCNFPNRYLWTGGSFLRHDWLFFLALSICALKKDRPALAGFGFAYATLLRLFPGVVALGPLLAAIEYFRLHRSVDRQFVKFVASGLVSTAVLVGLSFVFVNTSAKTTYRAVARALEGGEATVTLTRIETETGGAVTWLRPPRFELGAAGVEGLALDVNGEGALTISGRAMPDGAAPTSLVLKIAGGDSLAVQVTAGQTAMQVAEHLVTAVEGQAARDATSGGFETWRRFAQNTLKHSNTPLRNHMGLRTVLSWRPSATGSKLVQRGTLDAWETFKTTRLEKWNEAKPLFVVIMIAALVLVYLALRHSGPTLWLSAALGIGLIPFGVELTNYYYCFLIGIAVLHTLKREVGLYVCALAAVGLLINLAPLPFMTRELDEQYVAVSVASLFAVVGIWWAFTQWGAQKCIESEPEVLPETFSSAASARPPKKRK